MESSHLVIFSTSGKFITKFNVLRCISFKENTILDRVRGRIPITLNTVKNLTKHVSTGEVYLLYYFLCLLVTKLGHSFHVARSFE